MPAKAFLANLFNFSPSHFKFFLIGSKMHISFSIKIMLLWIHKYADLGFMSTHQAHCANFLIPFPPGSLGLSCSSLTPQHLSEWWMFADLAAEKLFPLYYLYHYRCHLLCILNYFFCIIRHSLIYYRNIGCGPETEKIMALWKMERQWAFRGEWWRGGRNVRSICLPSPA